MSDTSSISSITSSLSSQIAEASDRVVKAIKDASQRAGVDFNYMLSKANQESGLDPNAKASGSSATGLYQFVEQTWLRMVKQHGEKYGLGAAADQISIGSDGVARVKDSSTKKDILALRTDPCLSADMAAELTCDNKAALQKEVGGKIGGTELYLAHFLGAGGASDLLSTMKSDPNAKAADILPQAASANASVFYDKNGNAKSVSDVYKTFASKFGSCSSNAIATAAASKLSASGVTLASATNNDLSSDTSFAANLAGISPYGSSLLDTSSFSSPLAALMIAQTGDLADYSRAGAYADEQRRNNKQSTSLYGITA